MASIKGKLADIDVPLAKCHSGVPRLEAVARLNTCVFRCVLRDPPDCTIRKRFTKNTRRLDGDEEGFYKNEFPENAWNHICESQQLLQL